MDLILYRLTTALLTPPTLEDGWQFAQLCVLSTLLLLPLGFAMGFFQISVIRSPHIIGQAIATAFFFPALTEELVFRALLIPHPSEPGATPWIAMGISLFLFVIYHPLNAFTFFPAGRTTFIHPPFLLLAALLGGACTLIYRETGSLWFPILLHWLAVILWLLCLGGYSRLYAR